MKCTSCGAETSTNPCEFCGSEIVQEQPDTVINITNNYEVKNENGGSGTAACPKCGGHNVTFKRENQGEVRGKKAKAIIHKTVGVCKDCGYT